MRKGPPIAMGRWRGASQEQLGPDPHLGAFDRKDSENLFPQEPSEPRTLVAHDCGYPLSRYTCRATRVAADFLDFIAFCWCSTGVALKNPLKLLVSHLPPPPVPGGVAPKFGPEKVSRYTGVSQLQLRVSRYTVQLSREPEPFEPSRPIVTEPNRQSNFSDSTSEQTKHTAKTCWFLLLEG